METTNHGPRGGARTSSSFGDSASRSCSASRWLVSQSVRQSTRTGRPSGSAAKRAGKIERRVDRLPAFAAPRPVQRDALGHLVVEGLRGRDIGPGRRMGRDQLLGMRALAGARTAEKEGQALPVRQSFC